MEICGLQCDSQVSSWGWRWQVVRRDRCQVRQEAGRGPPAHHPEPCAAKPGPDDLLHQGGVKSPGRRLQLPGSSGKMVLWV